jgi:hypothetical protein
MDLKLSSKLASETATVPTSANRALGGFFTNRIGMNANENALLLQEAQQWKLEVDPVDAQAHALIDAIHAKTPGGRLAPGQEPPVVPPELVNLQKQRDAITLKHISSLQRNLGSQRFASLDKNTREQVREGPITTPATRPSIARGISVNQ